jgi:Fe-S cluster assembly ATPase SufC
MLELKNISYSAETENGTKGILKNINLTIDAAVQSFA